MTGRRRGPTSVTPLVTILAASVAATILTACAPGPRPSISAPAASSEPPISMVVLLDASSSYINYLGVAIEQLRPVLLGLAQPGSPEAVVHMRMVGADSWSPAAHLRTFEIPAIPSVPAPAPTAPPYDPELGAVWDSRHAAAVATVERAQDAARAAIEEALRWLSNLDIEPEDGTDLVGAFAAAEHLLAARPNARRMLVVASDLVDCVTVNAAGECLPRRIEANLDGVEVLLLGFVAPHPSEGARGEQAWREFFTDAGAVNVRVVFPGEWLPEGGIK